VAHLCNHGYSGGRVQKDCGSKPAGANSLWDLTRQTPSEQKGWWCGSSGRVPA
jgi:hypothetical protein